jgi:uncharacterized repeat protein (TIGR01451 family)
MVIQTSVGEPPGYDVPAGGGVITSWSMREAGNLSGQIRLKIVKSLGGGDYRIVSQSPYEHFAQGLNTYRVRMPVAAGETLAMWISGDPISIPDCEFSTNDSSDYVGSPSNSTEPQPTETVNVSPSSSLRLNASAQVEPDADHDGYGDETQDRANLSLSLSGPSHASVGGLAQYHLKVGNTGFGAARNTVLVDRLPARAKFVGASNPAGPCKAVPHGVACQLGVVRKGKTVAVTVIARLRKRGTAIDTAHVASSTPDPRPGNNLAGVATSVTPR